MPAFTYKMFLSGLYDTSDTGGITFTEAVVHQPYVLADSASDTSISLGGLTTATIFYIKSDQDITINLNSNSGTDITISANKPALFTGTSITALYGSNASGTDANLYIVLAGS
jgi:hypothetical protein